MYDKSLILEIFYQIKTSVDIVLARFKPIKNVNYFTDTPHGMEKLDAICMQLIAIGESVKNIDKITEKSLLEKYDNIDWKGIKGMRDVITHHYFDIDAEIIYDVCKNHIPKLKQTIEFIILDLEN